MKVKNIEISKIIPYDKNPRSNDKAVKYVKKSIEKFGFKVPLVIDKNNVIVTGHTRHKAALELGFDSLPCVVADDLTESQINAFRIADNKVGEIATWNIKLLQEEMRLLPEFDFTDFGFEYKAPGENNNGSQRNNTFDGYNMDFIDEESESFWGYPDVEWSDTIPDKLIGFNEVLTAKNFDCGVHFYLDDYQFERIWNNPEKYIEKLKQFQCVIAPDFSLYANMPKAMQIWNVYRSRTIAKALSDANIDVIPCIQYSDKDSYAFSFENLPKGGVVSLSSVGCVKDKEALEMFVEGVNYMLEKLNPEIILLYGTKPKDVDFGNVKIIEFKNVRGKKE